MKKKMNIGVMGTSLSRGEMKKIMAGSGGNASCNCVMCELNNGGFETYPANCWFFDPSTVCNYWSGDIWATGTYGICW